MPNVKLIIAYDGTAYLGWQKTSMGPSIEGALQEALERVLQAPVSLQAASRTDAGVHAQGQVVNFISEKEDIDLSKLYKSVNSLLPSDIRVLHLSEAVPSFHPTLDCLSKEYHYHLCYGAVQMPHCRLTSWHHPYPLDFGRMREAAQGFLGRHDFSSLCNQRKNLNYASFERELTRLDIIELPENRLRIEVEGSAFLYRMVRNIAGTLAYIGNGKLSEKDISDILDSGDRKQAGMTAPAHGLSLIKIILKENGDDRTQ